MLTQEAETFGFRGQVWTSMRVAQIIKKVLGVSYHPGHCRRLLRALKWSQQKSKKLANRLKTSFTHIVTIRCNKTSFCRRS